VESLLIIVLAIAGVWGLFLLPSFIESRREAPLTSTNRYGEVAQRLSQVQAGSRSGVSQRTLARRRRVLIFSSALAVASLAFAIISSSVGALVAHLVVDAFIAWYVAMIVQLRNQQQQQALRAHSLATVDRFDEVRVIAG
jgi:hypothetical protein